MILPNHKNLKSVFLKFNNQLNFEKIVILFILLMGVLLSASQFFYNRSLWLDEAMLTHSILNCGFFGLLHPLAYFQVAPISFLLSEKIFSLVIPNSEYGLRLFPMISYCASLFFFYKIVKLIFQNDYAIIFALSLFVFNPTLIYYASEVKQYMTDVMVISLLYYLLLKNYKNPEYKYYFLGIAGVISISLSNVAPIILSTVALFLFYEIKHKDKKYILKYTAVISAWLISFGIYYSLFIANHPAKGFMLDYWGKVDAFLPVNPLNYNFYLFLKVKLFMVVHSLFNFGFIRGICLRFFISIGLLFIIFKRKISLLIITLLPILLHLFLSALKLYPFDLRLILYMTPLFIILATFGFKYLLEIVFTDLKIQRFRLFAIGMPLVLVFFCIGKLPLQKEEIKKSLQFYKENREVGDKLNLYYCSSTSFNFYKKNGFVNNTVIPLVFGSWEEGISEKDINELTLFKGRQWILFSHFNKNEESFLINKLDSLGYTKSKEYKTYGSSIYLYDFSSKTPMIDTTDLKGICNK